MPATQFLLSRLAPMDSIPLDHITSVEIVGDRVYFNTVGDDGKKGRREHTKTEFILKQIQEYRIDVQGA